MARRRTSDDQPTDRVTTDLLASLQRTVNVDQLAVWPGDPFQHDIGAATVRDATFGKLRLPVVIDGQVVYAADLVEAERCDPKDQGMVRVLDLTPLGWAPRKAHAWAVGQMTADREATADDVLLAELLIDLHQTDRALAEAAGWDGDDLDALLERMRADGTLDDGPGGDGGLRGDEDDVPPPPAEPVTRRGDVWLLGPHRVMCGDSTDKADVEQLLNGATVELLLADPPYFGKVEADWDNDFDGFEGFLNFLSSVFAIHEPLLAERGTAGWFCAPDFAWHIEDRLRRHFAVFNHVVWFKGHGLGTTVSVEEMRRWRPRTERLLLCEKQHSPDALLASFNAKTAHIAARKAYATQIDRLIAWREQSGLTNAEIDQALGKNGMAGHYFGRSQWALPAREAWDILRPLFAARGVDIGEFEAQRREFEAQREGAAAVDLADQLSDCWVIAPPAGEERLEHPSPKPVAMFCKIVAAHSRDGDRVLDPFLGTGTTILATHLVGGGRLAYGMELSPAYVDVICARWQRHTGIAPVLQATGEPHDFLGVEDGHR